MFGIYPIQEGGFSGRKSDGWTEISQQEVGS